jgi:hypothetical protein
MNSTKSHTASTKIVLDVCTPEGTTWLARIVSTDGKYGLERDFLHPVDRRLSKNGKTGDVTYLVDNGVYEAYEGRRKLGRSFYIIRDGEARKVDRVGAVEEFEGS